MGQVVHLQQNSPASRIDEIEAEVFETVDRMCLRVGELLHEARTLDKRGFTSWVEERMPFGLDRAKRLIAIHLAYSTLPESTLAQCPRPWQALYALRHWAGPALEDAIASGEIGPDTTQREAQRKAREWSTNGRYGTGARTARYSTADLRAGHLMECEANELDENVLRALRRWLDHRAIPGIEPGNRRT